MSGSGFGTDLRPGVRGLALILALLLAAGALVGAFAGAASAGDQPAVFTIEPEEVGVEPGETVELDVVIFNHGPLQGEGLSEIAFDVRYDPEVVSEAAVEHDDWLLHGGDEESADEDVTLDGSAEVDEDEGLISVAQEREPAGDGVYGHGTAATITLTVEEDADPTTFEVAFEDTTALIPSGIAHFVWDHEATVSVGTDGADGDDGGADRDDDSGADDVDGVTLGDDADLSGSEDGADDENETDDLPMVENGDDPGTDRGEETTVPGFGVLVAMIALVAAAAVLFAVRDEP